MALRAQRGWGYIDGTNTAPKDPSELLEWKAVHDQIVGALRTMVEASLQHKLEPVNNVEVAWNKLKEKTHSKGIILKLKCLSSAIQNHMTPDTPASNTITEIKTPWGRSSKGGHP